MSWCNLLNFTINLERYIQEFLCSSQKHIHTVILLIICIFKYLVWLAQWQYWKLICSVVSVLCCEYQTGKKSNVLENFALYSLMLSSYWWFSFEPKRFQIRWDNILNGIWETRASQILFTWSLQKFGSMLQSSWRMLCQPSNCLVLLKLNCLKISYTRIWDSNWLLIWERSCSSL